MKDKIITALKEEVALLEQANVTQIDKHIYTMEKLLDILKEDKIIIDRLQLLSQKRNEVSGFERRMQNG